MTQCFVYTALFYPFHSAEEAPEHFSCYYTGNKLEFLGPADSHAIGVLARVLAALFLIHGMGKQQRMAEGFGPLQPHWRPRGNSWLLALDG